MANTNLRIDFFYKISKLIVEAYLQDIKVFPFSFFRTPEEQKKLYNQGLSKCDGIVKKSKHQLWKAIDLMIFKDGKGINIRTPEYERLGEIWKSLNGIWGGEFKNRDDIFHFEI